MKQKIKGLVLITIIVMAVLITASSVTKEYAISETLKQIENPNPQAMEAYTQYTGNPTYYMDELYKSLNQLTGK